MLRMVLDTDVVVAAILSAQGASRAILESISEGVRIALISVPLLIEYEAVLSRPNLMKEAGLDRREVDTVLDGLALIMEPVGIHYLWRPLLADPYDDMVLETAVNGQAAAIVSFNVKDYGDIPASFGMDLLQPRDAIKRLRSP